MHQDSNTLFDGFLVCPGCARSGLRGGVRNRSNSNDARTAESSEKPQLGLHAVPRPTAILDSPNGAASTEVPAVGSTFHTSLGVVVDTCVWRRRSDASLSGMTCGDRVAGNGEL